MSNPTQSDASISTLSIPTWEQAGYHVLEELKDGKKSRERLHLEIGRVTDKISEMDNRLVAQETGVKIWATIGGAVGATLAQVALKMVMK